MGLSFYTCHNCGGISINDCVRCNDGCDITWCSEECAQEDGRRYGISIEASDEDEYYTCSYCREEVADDYELLNFALKKLGLSRDTLQKEYLST